MPRPRTSTVRQRVEFGLRTIPKTKRVSVSLRDLMYVHQVVAEYLNFFHQPMHYPEKRDIEEFLGHAASSGASGVLRTAREKMRPMLPKEIHEAFADGYRFEHPFPPAYHAERAHIGVEAPVTKRRTQVRRGAG